jgi:GMC oxidoreductase/FAD binding domain
MSKRICIVGAGLAGGVLASELCHSGYDVTVVERGNTQQPYEAVDEIWEFDKPKASFTRGVGPGGTSNFWHGGLTVFDRQDVEGISDHFGGHKYPVSYDVMSAYYDRALQFASNGAKIMLSDMVSEPNEHRNEFLINRDLFRYKGLVYPSNTFSTKHIFQDLSAQNRIKFISQFEVKKLHFSSASCIDYIEGINTLIPSANRIHADIFILSAGGLGSPKVLLTSATDNKALAALPLGKYLTDHPTGFVFKAKLRKRMNLGNLFGQKVDGYRIQYGFALNPDKLSITGNKNHILYLRPAITMKDPLQYDVLKRKLVGYKGKRLRLSDIMYLMKHSDLLYEAVNFKFGLFPVTRHVSGLTFLEQTPNERDSIALTNDGRYSIKWGVSKEDGKSAHIFMEAFMDSHSNMFDNYKIFPELDKRLETAGHHSGACRMAQDSTRGVVDANLKVFGVDNLYVADASVLGYSGHANTGLSIIALAVKCADDIKKLYG